MITWFVEEDGLVDLIRTIMLGVRRFEMGSQWMSGPCHEHLIYNCGSSSVAPTTIASSNQFLRLEANWVDFAL